MPKNNDSSQFFDTPEDPWELTVEDVYRKRFNSLQLEGLNCRQLKAKCRELGIKGYGSMRKADLIWSLLNCQEVA